MQFSQSISAVDVHACGEPGRVIIGGVLDVPGATMYEKMRHFATHRDGLRKRMLREPRGYPAMCCNLLLPPANPEADAGFIIMEQTEYPAMSGSNTICVVTVLIETGMVRVTEPVTRLKLDTPAGLISVEAEVRGGKCQRVTFENVPAFVAHLDATVALPTVGDVTVDVAWGGMWYVIAEAADLGLTVEPDSAGEIARLGAMLTRAASEQLVAEHPDNPALRHVSISQISGPGSAPGASRRNAVVVSSGAIDWERPDTWRGVIDCSPCGTGTCAKMAALHARGELSLGEAFHHQSIVGTEFVGRLIRETSVAGTPAVVPTLGGTAWITGFATYVLDPDDPFPEGFTVGDLWAGGT